MSSKLADRQPTSDEFIEHLADHRTRLLDELAGYRNMRERRRRRSSRALTSI